MRTSIYLLLTCMFMIAACSGDKYQGQRMEKCLNGEWLFCIDPLNQGTDLEWQANEMQSGKTVRVPHTWNTDSIFQHYYGKAWYYKEFDVPLSWKGKQVRIRFERIFHHAVIWINGQLASEHKGSGYTTFYADISDLIITGGMNTISVSVDNQPDPQTIPYMDSYDWAMDGGITGDVKLIATERPAVQYVLVHTSSRPVEDVINGQVTLQILLDESFAPNKRITKFNISIKEENQATSNVLLSSVLRARHSSDGYIIDIELPSVNRWHFDTPNLYELKVEPLLRGRATDRYTTTFGFREFEIRDGSLYLNDERVRLSGVEWMPGSDPDMGFAETEAHIRKVLSDMKELNCVFTRFHWQQREKTIDLCNRLGILVQEEIPLWQKPSDFSSPPLSEIAKKHAREMIYRNFNAPSIIAWGIGNELPSLNDDTKRSLLQLKEYVESLDSSRIVSYVSNHIGTDPKREVSRYFDWIMMNDYYGTWFGDDHDEIGQVLDRIHELYPEKPVIIAEWGLCERCNPDYNLDGGDPRRIRDMAAHYEQYITRPWVQGHIYFSYNDYRTHMGLEGTGRFRQRKHGVVDLLLNPKPSYELLKRINAPIEYEKTLEEGDSIIILFRNKDTLPSYTIRNYTADIVSETGDIPDRTITFGKITPGEPIRITLPGQPGGLYRINFTRPGGHHVLEHTVQVNN